MAKFRTHKSGFVAVLALLAVAVIITYAYAALKTETNQVTYTDTQRFRSRVYFDAPGPAQPAQIYFGANSEINFQSGSKMDFESGSDINYDSGSGVTFSGTRTENSTMANVKVPLMVSLSGTSRYSVSKANGSLFWLDTFQSTDGTRSANSGVSIILPKITSAYNGYTAKFFIANGLYTPGGSGATTFSGTTYVCFTTTKWTSGTTDHIWRGSSSGTTVESATQIVPEWEPINAAGTWVELTAFYAASGSTWYLSGCSL